MAVPRPRGIGARLLESDCDPLLLLGESGTGRDESVASYAVGAEPCGNWLMWSGLLSRRGGEAPPGWLPGGASSLLPGGMVVAAARVVVDGVSLPTPVRRLGDRVGGDPQLSAAADQVLDRLEVGQCRIPDRIHAAAHCGHKRRDIQTFRHHLRRKPVPVPAQRVADHLPQ